jgi:hypothetical protein
VSDMDTDRILEAESSSNPTRRIYTSGDHNNAIKTSVGASVATDSGYNKQLVSSILEDSPLLSNGSASGRNGAPNGNEGVEWHGAKDFEDLPWWRRPSVRTN